MTWNGSGTFTRTLGSAAWVGDAAAGTLILASRHDTNDLDLATGINAAVAKNGENAYTGTTGTTALRGAVDNTSDLGSSSLRWRNLYAGTSVVFQGASFATTVTAAPTANRAVVMPNESGTLVTSAGVPAAAAAVSLAFNTATTAGATVSLVASGLAATVYNEIVIMFRAVSLSGTDDILIQIGDDTGFVTSGYGTVSTLTPNGAVPSARNSTTGFILLVGNAGFGLNAVVILTRVPASGLPDGDSWLITGSGTLVGSGAGVACMGVGTLNSASPVKVLDRIRLATTGANTFDAGAVWVTGRY